MRLFGPGHREQEARDAESRGDYAQAAALFAEAGFLEDAARVTILRGDAEPRSGARLRHYARAASLAPEGSPLQAKARTKRALALVAIASEGPATAAARRDLKSAAQDLEALGEHELAADAYARADDTAGQLRALERAGSTDAVEALLAGENARARDERGRRRESDEFMLLLASGRRREAVALARASGDAALRERGEAVSARRLDGRDVRVVAGDREMRILVGDRVVVGRAPDPQRDGALVAAFAVGSAAVSRNHLLVHRRDGQIVVRDLGSRHGTETRGLALGGEVPVGDGIVLRLGRAVSIALRPATEIAGALAIEVGESRVLAPLGPAYLGVGRWRLERSADGWIELVTDDAPPAYAGALRWADRVTLLAGDAAAVSRSAAPSITVDR